MSDGRGSLGEWEAVVQQNYTSNDLRQEVASTVVASVRFSVLHSLYVLCKS